MEHWCGIRNWRNQPVPGGWNVAAFRLDADHLAATDLATSPDDAFSQIMSAAHANDISLKPDEVARRLSEIYGQRAPDRYQGPPAARHEKPFEGGQDTVTPEQYGPFAWGVLHYYGTHFVKESFDAHVRWMLGILDETLEWQNNMSGCAYCHLHFLTFIKAYPLEKVTTRDEAAIWAWMAHNAACEAKKVKKWTYAWSAERWSTRRMTDKEITLISTRLQA